MGKLNPKASKPKISTCGVFEHDFKEDGSCARCSLPREVLEEMNRLRNSINSKLLSASISQLQHVDEILVRAEKTIIIKRLNLRS